MTKLNQIIAIEKGIKSNTHKELSDIYKLVQKGTELFNGFVRTYQAKDQNDDEKLPDEKKKVQLSVPEVLGKAWDALADLLNITARKDWTNSAAYADIKVDGITIVEKAPVTYLLFLEKSLTDLRTFAASLPILDESEDWTQDPNTNLYKTSAIDTHRTKKVQKPLVLYPATPEHPAQTQMVTEDIIAGYWKSIKHSGALPKVQKDSLVDRIERLLQGVKQAREEANGVDEVIPPSVSEEIKAYLFGK